MIILRMSRGEIFSMLTFPSVKVMFKGELDLCLSSIKKQDIFIFRYDWERYKRQQKEYINSGIVPKQCSRRRVKSKMNVKKKKKKI